MSTSGFPLRPTRDDFGPEPVNRTPVRSAEMDLDAETIGRLMFHQLAGLGQVVPLAVLIINADGSLAFRWEAWNRNRATTGDYAPPAIDVSTPGVVLIEYSATVPDRLGEGQPLAFRGGVANVQSADKVYGNPAVLPASPLGSSVTVQTSYFDSGAFVAGLDAPLFVALW